MSSLNFSIPHLLITDIGKFALELIAGQHPHFESGANIGMDSGPVRDKGKGRAINKQAVRLAVS